MGKINSSWDDVANGVYAVSKDVKPVAVDKADETCVAVALVVNDAPVPQMFMIAKTDATDADGNNTLYWNYNYSSLSLPNCLDVDDTNSHGYLPMADGNYYGTPQLSADYTTWPDDTALGDFDGKGNIAIIAVSSSNSRDMCTVLNTFNAAIDGSNLGKNNWYIPAFGQLALMYLNQKEINDALAKIGGTAFDDEYYWASTMGDRYGAWVLDFDNGGCSGIDEKGDSRLVRFVRDIEE